MIGNVCILVQIKDSIRFLNPINTEMIHKIIEYSSAETFKIEFIRNQISLVHKSQIFK